MATATRNGDGASSRSDQATAALAQELRQIHQESAAGLAQRSQQQRGRGLLSWVRPYLSSSSARYAHNGGAGSSSKLTTPSSAVSTVLDFTIQYARWLAQTWTRVPLTLISFSLVTRPLDLISLFIWASIATLLITVFFALDVLIALFPSSVGVAFDEATDYLIAGRQSQSSKTKEEERFRVLFADFPAGVREAAFKALSSPSSIERATSFPASDDGNTHIVDLDVSKLLLALCGLIYTRRRKAMAQTLLQAPPTNTTDPDSIIRLTAQSCFSGLQYQPICELGRHRSPLSPGSPVAGLFYHPSHPDFIIVAFKGTSPAAFSEWVVDFDYSYVDGTAWLGPGYEKVHRGFYASLYPVAGEECASGVAPYEWIRRAVVATARTLRSLNGGKTVNVYVTGHSLGAALASMWYAGAVQRPGHFDLASDDAQAAVGSSPPPSLAIVRDLYVYGAPIFGDPHAVNAFNYRLREDDPGLSSSSTKGTALRHPPTAATSSPPPPPPTTPTTPPQLRREAWRLTNHRDAVGTLIPAFGDDATASSNLHATLSPSNSFNYAHVGQEIQLRSRPQLSETGPGTTLVRGTPVRVVSSLRVGAGKTERWIIDVPPLLVKAQTLVPVLGRLLAHAPLLYAQQLNGVKTNESGEPLPYADYSLLQ